MSMLWGNFGRGIALTSLLSAALIASLTSASLRAQDDTDEAALTPNSKRCFASFNRFSGRTALVLHSWARLPKSRCPLVIKSPTRPVRTPGRS